MVGHHGTASGTLPSDFPFDSTILVGAGTLVASPSDILGTPSSGSLGTATNSSTHRGTLDKVHVGSLCPTTRRDRSLAGVVATALLPLAELSLRVLLPALLLPAAPLVSSSVLLASSSVHLASFFALLPSFSVLLASSSALLASSAAPLASCATPPAFSAAPLASPSALLVASVAPLALSDSSTASPALPVPCSGALEPRHAAVSPQSPLWLDHHEDSQHPVSPWPKASHSLSPATRLPEHLAAVPSDSSQSVSLVGPGPDVLSLPHVATTTTDAFHFPPQRASQLLDWQNS